MLPNPQETEDLVTFTEEILNEKLHYLCSVILHENHRIIKDNKKISRNLNKYFTMYNETLK